MECVQLRTWAPSVYIFGKVGGVPRNVSMLYRPDRHLAGLDTDIKSTFHLIICHALIIYNSLGDKIYNFTIIIGQFACAKIK